MNHWFVEDGFQVAEVPCIGLGHVLRHLHLESEIAVLQLHEKVDFLAVALVALSAYLAFGKKMNVVLLVVLCAAVSSLRALLPLPC